MNNNLVSSAMNIAGASMLAGNGLGLASAAELLKRVEELVPGFAPLARWFKRWLKIDLTTLVTIAAVWGAVVS
jgi:hypothetical protein